MISAKINENSNIPNNIIDVINRLMQEIGSDSIVGIAIQGGYARNSYTEESDIDLIFLFDLDTNAVDVLRGFISFESYCFEIRHLYINRFDPKKWSYKQRYVYSNETVVLYEKENKFTTIKEQAKMNEEEQIKIIVESIRGLSKCGIVYHNNIEELWSGFETNDKLEYWVKRNDLFSAHVRLNECNEKIIRFIFALNLQFMPSAKHRASLLKKSEWLPDNFDELFKSIFCYDDFTLDNFYKRSNSYIELLDKCVDKALSMNLIPKDINKYYNENFSRFNDNII